MLSRSLLLIYFSPPIYHSDQFSVVSLHSEPSIMSLQNGETSKEDLNSGMVGKSPRLPGQDVPGCCLM